MNMIRKAKVNRSLRLLEDVHVALLEWLRQLQECDRKHRNKRNFKIKKEIEKLERLNSIIFELFSRFQDDVHIGLK